MVIFFIFFFLSLVECRRCRNANMEIGECKSISDCESSYYENGICPGSSICCMPAPKCFSTSGEEGRCRKSTKCTGRTVSGLCLGTAPNDVKCCFSESPVIPDSASRLAPILPGPVPPPSERTQPGDVWIKSCGGFPVEIVKRNTATYRARSGNPGSWVAPSDPVNKILLHTTEGSWPNVGDLEGSTGVLDSAGSWPHFIVGANRDGVHVCRQYLPLDEPGFALRAVDRYNVIQIEVSADAGKPFTKYDVILTEAVRALVQEIRLALPSVPNVVPRPFPTCGDCGYGSSSKWRFPSRSSFLEAAGIVGHSLAPGNTHWDPGSIDANPLLCLQPWCGNPPDITGANPTATQSPTPAGSTPRPTPRAATTPAPSPAVGSSSCFLLDSTICVSKYTLTRANDAGKGAYQVAREHGASLAEFYAWNPGTESRGVFLDATYVVACPDGNAGCTTGGNTPQPTPNPTPAPTPMPTNDPVAGCQLYMSDCVAVYTMEAPRDNGKGATILARDSGTRLADFYRWNPGTESRGLFLGSSYYIVCPAGVSACNTRWDNRAEGPAVANQEGDGDGMLVPAWVWPIIGVGVCVVVVILVAAGFTVYFFCFVRQQRLASSRASGRSGSHRSRRRSSARSGVAGASRRAQAATGASSSHRASSMRSSEHGYGAGRLAMKEILASSAGGRHMASGIPMKHFGSRSESRQNIMNITAADVADTEAQINEHL